MKGRRGIFTDEQKAQIKAEYEELRKIVKTKYKAREELADKYFCCIGTIENALKEA